MKKPKKLIRDIDINLKEIISELFEPFVEFCMPDIYEEINFNEAYEFLEQEFPKLMKGKYKKGTKINDKLVKVTLKNGERKYLYIHIELQHKPEEDFAERMFVYFYRIFDKYGKDIETLAVFTGKSESFKINSFENTTFQTKIKYDYRLFVVNQQDETVLLNSTNPFALVVLAMVYALKTESNDNLRLQYKTNLMRLMLKRKFNRNYIERILSFLANILTLPDEFETKFIDELNQQIKQKDMVLSLENYVANVYYNKAKNEGIIEGERKGLLKGILKGKLEGKLEGEKLKSYEFGIRLLEHNYSDEQITDLTGLSIAEVKILKQIFSEHGNNAYKYLSPNILNI